MDNKPNEKNIAVNTDHEISIWDIVTLILRKWKIGLIITLVITLIGAIYGLSGQNQKEYVFNQEVIYDDFDYYPVDFANTYALSLNSYLKQNYENHGDIKVTFTVSKNNEHFLNLRFSNMSHEQANTIADDIIRRHNSLMLEEVLRLVDNKSSEAALAYEKYSTAQSQYHTFLYGAEGFHITENELNRFALYISTHKDQLESKETVLQKVLSGVPLFLDDIYLDEGMPIDYSQREEIIKNHYSADVLQKEIEFLNNKIAEYQIIYDELNLSFNEMTIQNVTLKNDCDVTLKTWKQSSGNLLELQHASANVSEYYVREALLREVQERSWVIYTAIAAIAGFVLAVIFILIQASYESYPSKQKS